MRAPFVIIHSHPICFGKTSVAGPPLPCLNVRLWVWPPRVADRLSVFSTPAESSRCLHTNAYLCEEFTRYPLIQQKSKNYLKKKKKQLPLKNSAVFFLVGNFCPEEGKKQKKWDWWRVRQHETHSQAFWCVLQYPRYAVCCVNSCCLAHKPEHLEVTTILFSLA